jgi:hypothetical protein
LTQKAKTKAEKKPATKNLTLTEALAQGLPLIVSYGMGVDSTAMLVGLYRLGIVPDMILFADVGDEHPDTYDYKPVIDAWLASIGFPPLTVVDYRPKRFKYGEYTNLFGNCWQNKTLPSLAFGRKACSNKWKIAPMDKHVESVYADRFAKGQQVARAIGYDAGPKDSCRGGSITEDEKYVYVYPLRDWGWDRTKCKLEITLEENLTVPRKSSCFFCPSMQKEELKALAIDHPFLAALAVLMEDRAQPNLQKIGGLWRKGVKGTRDPSKYRPASWRQFLEEQNLLPHRTVMEAAEILVEKAVTEKAAVSFGSEQFSGEVVKAAMEHFDGEASGRALIDMLDDWNFWSGVAV